MEGAERIQMLLHLNVFLFPFFRCAFHCLLSILLVRKDLKIASLLFTASVKNF